MDQNEMKPGTLQSLFEAIDPRSIKAEVERLVRETREADPRDQARSLSRRAALRCAATGAMTGLPSGIKAVAAMGVDLAYLVYQQFRLILSIATVYGHEPSARERFSEALACFAYGSGVGLGKQGMAFALAAATANGAPLDESTGTRNLRKQLSKAAPVLGAISGGALNYFVTRAVGEATIRYYENHVDPALAEEIWQDGDREHA